MFGDSLSAIFFRLLNLLILIAIGYYLYLKYLKSKIDEKITQKEMLLKGLEEQSYFLESKSYDLEQRLQEQEKKAFSLRQKIADWRLQVAAQHAKKQEENYRNAQKVAVKIGKQNAMLVHTKWRAQVIPNTLHKVKDQLIARFSTPNLQKYNKEIIQRIKGDGNGH